MKLPLHSKAAILTEQKKPLIVGDIDLPKTLAYGQVFVKVHYSGICGSQIGEIDGVKGEDKYLPHLLGHEGYGKVVNTAADVTKVSADDWVILGWIKGEGLNADGAKYKLGDKIINSGGVTTFSTYTIVSENRIVPLPKGLPRDISVLFGCALPTGAGIVLNQIKPKKNSSIAFIGLGGIGLSGLMATKAFECKNIIAVDVSDEKLKLAKEFGATHIINASTSDVLKEINNITDGMGVDYSVDAGGKVETIELAFEAIKKNGGLSIFASHPEVGKKISIDPFDLISGKNIKGSWGGASRPDKDIPLLAGLYNKGMMPLEKLVTKSYKLDEINIALDDLKNSKVFRPLIVMDDF